MIRISLIAMLIFGTILSSCSDKSKEVKDLAIKYIDEYDQKLRPLEHETSFIHRIKNIESESEQLVELGKLILSEVLSDNILKDDKEIKEETRRLYELSTEFHDACKEMSDDVIAKNIKEMRDCLNKVRNRVRKITDSQ